MDFLERSFISPYKSVEFLYRNSTDLYGSSFFHAMKKGDSEIFCTILVCNQGS